MKKVQVSTKHQKFVVTQRKNKTWHVRIIDRLTNKTRDFECTTYRETGSIIWNQANNHEVSTYVCHIMCDKFRRFYWED